MSSKNLSLLLFSLCTGGLLLAPHTTQADSPLIQHGQITIDPADDDPILTLQGLDRVGTEGADYGLTLSYHDGTTGAAVLRIARPSGKYQWQLASPDRLAMELGNDHSLTLFNPTSDGLGSIVLQPDATNAQIRINNSPVVTVASLTATLTSGDQVLHTPEIYLPETLGEHTGVVYSGLDRFIHSYGVDNLFVGANAGNFDLIKTATEAHPDAATSNTALGANALRWVTTGNSNMAIGGSALSGNTTANANVAIGDRAMGGPQEITGGYNVAIGRAAGYSWSTGSKNVAIGFNSFYSSNGGWGENVAIGDYAMFAATGTVGENVGIGIGTLYSLEGALSNTAVGSWTGAMLTTGSGNTLIGDQAGNAAPNSLTEGSHNTFIGARAGLASPTQRSNATAIGYMAQVDANNAVVLGGTGDNAVQVGIGTSQPQAPLDVNGAAIVRGVLRVAPGGDIGMGDFITGTDPRLPQP